MAKRPIYIPSQTSNVLVNTQFVEFKWYPGLAPSRKQLNIAELHSEAISAAQCRNPLEISTKSKNTLGIALSAFNLAIDRPGRTSVPVECIFQSSKVFTGGGPFRDIRGLGPREAKRDERLKASGELVGFDSAGTLWPLEPKTAFYDWVYINTLKANVELAEEVMAFDAFSDIEFNPKKSINCQAYSVALFVALSQRGLLAEATSSKETYLELLSRFFTVNAYEDDRLMPRLKL